MADLDDIRDGDNFGLNTPADTSSFYLKGMNSASWGIKNRMSRIFNRKSGRTVMLAFDHGFLMGPTSGLERIDLNIAPLAEEADCLMGCRGMIRTSIPAENTKPICLRTDSGTTILTEMNHNVLISEIDAIGMNVSAMAAMLAIGDADTEASTVANFSKLVDIGNKYSIPVMGVTAVGKDMARDSRYFGLASRVCAENGASIVKTYYTEGFENVVAACPVPVVIAGGKKLPELEALELCYNAIQCGASGVDMGRNVFQSDKPLAMMRAVKEVVHNDAKPAEAIEIYNAG
ncbi:MAG: 3-hydroxy-5-phosphonooxypentane-2,4-dione thiolase [Akkermansiaceae bacterium]|jgi:putative autoinducer-2 (AI-2) aldolase|nr:3-hydroxy-5-phosphonooxypentane-2,4-dione thiolase [Akkermansiaceae bacterium]OUV11303.1 MAG: autoinducer 2 aldolase [Verrucomicrobiaceae bacterium TMED86]MCH1507619.1 3-hydroxy-5-phosphonooxypentane-2,4-dione thiolase [Akkermansiaceae bacterium]MDG1070328.1 3-hydroxy-5-phosphonooxypentane-2,4-dione thiolase [Akkermansiaceae bacterium]MDG1670120.1 3-hydroxy-5-phosphonooxypentane-2,4-dione thiolase [Akkermansiaceae bacterium]